MKFMQFPLLICWVGPLWISVLHLYLYLPLLPQNVPKRAKLESAGKENLVATRSQKPATKPAALAKRPASKLAAGKSASVTRKAPTAASKVIKPSAGAGGSKAVVGKPKRAAWDVKGRLQVRVCLFVLYPFTGGDLLP